ncbi:hypothetical protein BUALT_Bualt07G0131100 [Buddleja alternifolia]|uniref:Uncharacterized protein n=1 Tax=Buddleja alternifolia TaxID=168488 RepID=A0AAV6XL34_9LAMI|nr:hypothetical protein BUALT_Bualt07G0131100 [Buddleja alternifolia]
MINTDATMREEKDGSGESDEESDDESVEELDFHAICDLFPHKSSVALYFSMLTSQGLVLATAMAVSAGTILLFDLFREKYFPTSQFSGNQDSPNEKQVLKSCLSSGSSKKREKKKRVQFADDVKDSPGNGDLYRKQHRKFSAEIEKNSCGNEIQKMPANRRALYSGILRDRVQRTGYSY